MFQLRIVPLYLPLCALALAVWTSVTPGSAPRLTLGWAVAGMVALYAAAMVIERASRGRAMAVSPEKNSPSNEQVKGSIARDEGERCGSSLQRESR